MQQPSNRRSFLVQQGAAAIGIVGMGGMARVGSSAMVPIAGSEPLEANRWPGFPQQDPTLVREIVAAAHGKIERVTELLAAHPALAKASYDWGYGDWESALGAASHVGNRAIATMLLEHGARLDLFAAAMLGMSDVVKSTLAARPQLARTRGPHGISLVAHAAAGNNQELVAFLRGTEGGIEGAGDIASPPLTSDEMKVYLGSYALPEGEFPDGAVVVSETRLGLAIKVTRGAVTSPDRGLTRTGEHTFHPAGAPNVRVAFTRGTGAIASRVEIVESEWIVSATRPT